MSFNNRKNAEIVRIIPLRLTTLIDRAVRSYTEFYAYGRRKLLLTAVIGAITFPLYYFVWAILKPQRYESITLRAVGTALCVAAIFDQFSRYRDSKYSIVFSYALVTYCLPFFFTFMLLMNDFDVSWQSSTIIALVYMAILFDAINIFISMALGITSALIAYFAIHGLDHPPKFDIAYLLVVGFGLVSIFLLNQSNAAAAEERMRAATTLASHVAHEMRTPLLGIKLDADRANELLPALIEAHQWAKENGWKGRQLLPSQLDGMAKGMARISHQTQSANTVIDILLRNLGQSELVREEAGPVSMRRTIAATIDAYAFKPGERERVHVVEGPDFDFRGSELLVRHVFYNLIRNAMRALEEKGEGTLTITVLPDRRENKVVVSDTGVGINPEIVHYIFVPFYVGAKQGIGTGIGLPFCRMAMESLGGRITCRSEVGKGADFFLIFPAIR